jgi:hypothetical protein
MFIVIDFTNYTKSNPPIEKKFNSIKGVIIELISLKVDFNFYGGVGSVMRLIVKCYDTGKGFPMKTYEKDNYQFVFCDTDKKIFVCYDKVERRKQKINEIIN